MRITNKIMQRNNLSNINTNKVYQDKLSTQMSTQKKVSRPSDDPVVSIRALRLRSNVTEVTQYYSKNIPDAESWLDVTEDALKNLTEIITNMIKQCTKASNGDLKSADRQIILEQLKALGDEVYSTGDADYAGRYVFTGYRTFLIIIVGPFILGCLAGVGVYRRPPLAAGDRTRVWSVIFRSSHIVGLKTLVEQYFLCADACRSSKHCR